MRRNQRSLVGALTAATTAVALLAAPWPAAQAEPCSQWAFPPRTTLQQSNGWALIFTMPKATKLNRVSVDDGRGGRGRVDGSIEGYEIKLFVQWDSGVAGPYEGSVDANGYAHGFTYDIKNPGSSAKWDSVERFICITPG